MVFTIMYFEGLNFYFVYAYQLFHLYNLFYCGCCPTVKVLFLLPAQQLKFKWGETNRVTNNMLWYTFS